MKTLSTLLGLMIAVSLLARDAGARARGEEDCYKCYFQQDGNLVEIGCIDNQSGGRGTCSTTCNSNGCTCTAGGSTCAMTFLPDRVAPTGTVHVAALHPLHPTDGPFSRGCGDVVIARTYSAAELASLIRASTDLSI